MRRLPGRVEPPLQVSAAPTPSSGPLKDILIFGSDEEPNGLHCGQPGRKLATSGEMAAGGARPTMARSVCQREGRSVPKKAAKAVSMTKAKAAILRRRIGTGRSLAVRGAAP